MRYKFLFFCVFLQLILVCCSNDVSVLDCFNDRVTDFEYDSDLYEDVIVLANGMHVVRKDSLYLFEGDIVLPQSFVDRVDSMRMNRSANVHDGVLYWPRCTVPYSFHSSVPNSSKQTFINAMESISASTGVVFRPYVSQDRNQVQFKYGTNGNDSSLGMQGGTQIINIESVTESVITHELMHALGFHHEQCRSDRNNYIRINYSNIRPSKWHNFSRYNSGADFGPFDFDSIMLYDPFTTDTDFVFDTSEPMMYLANGSIFNANNTQLSSGDISALKNIYGPPYHRLEITETVLQDDFDGVSEIYRTYYSAEVAFYMDKACTIPVTLDHDRLILLRVDERTGSSMNQIIHYGGYQQPITIPAGTQRVVVGSHENIEHTVQASPYMVDVVSMSIVNDHVSPIYSYVQ